eukprot:TRINITY_DN5068_c0_g1_i1.p1 TRINITY_DN5068_c0_g1~~TRINITY_DN5068_c0_g1_i1.p1  ORF type:complete len:530 (+),score=74.35 TRINITY_DN5068_c0_g1_i1:298-1887(+)
MGHGEGHHGSGGDFAPPPPSGGYSSSSREGQGSFDNLPSHHPSNGGSFGPPGQNAGNFGPPPGQHPGPGGYPGGPSFGPTYGPSFGPNYGPSGTYNYPGYPAMQPRPQVVVVQQRGRNMREVKPRREEAGCCYVCCPLINLGVFLALGYAFFIVFASHTLRVGVHENRLLTANSLFVRAINVKAHSDFPLAETTVLAYSSPPALNREHVWWDCYTHVVVGPNSYKYFPYYLNKGSTITILFGFPYAQRLVLAVMEGAARMDQWKSSPYTFSDYVTDAAISGHGQLSFTAQTEGEYYIALGNLLPNQGAVTITYFKLMVHTFLYSRAHAPVSSCVVTRGQQCHVSLGWRGTSAVVLATPENKSYPPAVGGLWDLKISYWPRWTTYLGIMAFTLLVTYFISSSGKKQSPNSNPPPLPISRAGPLADPLLDSAPQSRPPHSQVQPYTSIGGGPLPSSSQEAGLSAPIPPSWEVTGEEVEKAKDEANASPAWWSSTDTNPSAPPLEPSVGPFGADNWQGTKGSSSGAGTSGAR